MRSAGHFIHKAQPAIKTNDGEHFSATIIPTNKTNDGATPTNQSRTPHVAKIQPRIQSRIQSNGGHKSIGKRCSTTTFPTNHTQPFDQKSSTRYTIQLRCKALKRYKRTMDIGIATQPPQTQIAINKQTPHINHNQPHTTTRWNNSNQLRLEQAYRPELHQ